VPLEHVCALGCEGIVSKKGGSHYDAGRTDTYLRKVSRSQPTAGKMKAALGVRVCPSCSQQAQQRD